MDRGTRVSRLGDGLPLQQGQLLDGKYEIGALLGSGAMGLVYEGYHRLLAKPMAIKVLRPEATQNDELRSRFEAEARAAAAASHPNIVAVTDMGRTPTGAVYFVMDRLKGETLGERLERESRLEYAAIGPIALGILSGLEAAHALGLVHRDLKPDNVFLALTPDGAELPKILDFGIAKALCAVGKREAGTVAGTLMGTPAYMAPEQARAEPDIDARADLYAMGVILYRMVCGRCPFLGDEPMVVMTSLLMDTPPSPYELAPKIPRALAQLIEDAMSRDRRARPASAKHMRERLASALGNLPSATFAMPMPIDVRLSVMPLDEIGGAPAPSAPQVATSRAAPDAPLELDDHRTGAQGQARSGMMTNSLEQVEPSSVVADGSSRRNSRTPLFVGIAVAGLVGVAIVAWQARARPGKSTTDGVETATAMTSDGTEVIVVFKVEPEHATLLVDGKPIKANPIKIPQSTALHKITATLKGYETRTIDFRPDISKTVNLSLFRAGP